MPTAEGISHIPSKRAVDEIVESLRNAFQEKGLTLFSVIDHSGEAEKAGMKMPPTKLLLFGNPQAGTPVMLAAPSIALDLPLKLLVWQDSEDQVWISYNSADYLRERHHVSEEFLRVLAAPAAFAKQAAS